MSELIGLELRFFRLAIVGRAGQPGISQQRRFRLRYFAPPLSVTYIRAVRPPAQAIAFSPKALNLSLAEVSLASHSGLATCPSVTLK